jgi:hypothetical protein
MVKWVLTGTYALGTASRTSTTAPLVMSPAIRRAGMRDAGIIPLRLDGRCEYGSMRVWMEADR